MQQLNLELYYFEVPDEMGALRVVTDALSENSTLQCMEVWVILPESGADSSHDPDECVSEFMQREQMKHDPRIIWRNRYFFFTATCTEAIIYCVIIYF